MKILWVDFALPYLLKDADYPVGGWAVELRSWLAGAERTGRRAGVLTWSGANDYVGRDLPFDLVESYDPAWGPRVLKYPLRFVPALRRAIANAGPDVVIQACASVMTGMVALAARQSGVAFVYRVANDIDVDGRYRQRLRIHERLIYRYGLRSSSLMVCQNSYQLAAVRAAYPGKPSAALVNPFAIADESAPAPASARKYIAWLGVFQAQKNLPLLLRIARALPAVPFRIAGKRGSTVDPETDRALQDLERLPNVEFVGYLGRTQVMQFLGGAVALLNTSHYEGFSNSYLEAFSRGTPVIAPCAADPDGIIGGLGLGRAVAEEAGFVRAIDELIAQDGEESGRLAAACRAYVEERHDPARLTECLVAELENTVRPVRRA